MPFQIGADSVVMAAGAQKRTIGSPWMSFRSMATVPAAGASNSRHRRIPASTRSGNATGVALPWCRSRPRRNGMAMSAAPDGSIGTGCFIQGSRWYRPRWLDRYSWRQGSSYPGVGNCGRSTRTGDAIIRAWPGHAAMSACLRIRAAPASHGSVAIETFCPNVVECAVGLCPAAARRVRESAQVEK